MEKDEKALEAARYISQYCQKHQNCNGCMFSFSQVCILKWTKANQWNESIEKVMNRRLQKK
jgi:hypothetical protein